jgi:hypothetical protein
MRPWWNKGEPGLRNLIDTMNEEINYKSTQDTFLIANFFKDAPSLRNFGLSEIIADRHH